MRNIRMTNVKSFCNCGLVFLLVVAAGVTHAADAQSVLVEAEAFADYGGWLLGIIFLMC